ncbi:hypothetical protein OG21DRAFT_1423825, partial [Imleria badia]
ERAYTRLLRILISESAHLIWALRCERVISERSHSATDIRTRWTNKINLRINIDRRRAKLPKRPSLPKQIQLTWQPILSDKTHLPQDWVTNLEVLVGIKLPRPSD